MSEKKIFLSEFERKVNDGPVGILITEARYDTIKTKKGKDSDLVKLTVEVQELSDPMGNKEMKNINMFINYTPGGAFNKLVKATLDVVKTTAFTPSLLIGLKGKAVLYHYKPEDYEFAFPQINDWIFYASSEKVSEALEKYINDDVEDIDF